jgi:hypothetical protein
LLIKHVQGKVKVSPRTVILELPDHFKLAKVMFKLYHHAQEALMWKHHVDVKH